MSKAKQFTSLERLTALETRYTGCQGCPLHESRTKLVHWRGSASARLFIIGAAPGADEDAQGRPFVGMAGRKLDEALAAAGRTAEDVFIANTVACRTPCNREPHRGEVRACNNRLRAMLDIVRPGAVLMLGATAARLMGVSSLKQWRGTLTEWEFLDRDKVRRYPAVCSWHPACILRQGLGEDALTRVLTADIEAAWEAANDAQ